MKRDQTFEIRLTAEDKAAIRAAAEQAQRTASDWARLALLAAVKQSQAAKGLE